MVKKLESRLRECFTTYSFTEEELNQLLARLRDEETARDARADLKTIKGKLRNAVLAGDALTVKHRGMLEGVFQKHFPMEGMVSRHLGDKEDDSYMQALSEYRHEVAESFKTALVELERDKDLDGVDSNTRKAMEMASTKARLLLNPQFVDDEDDFIHFPLMSPGFYCVLKRNLKDIQRALLEVCVLFICFIQKLFHAFIL